MTVTIDSNHISKHDKLIKKIDAAIQQKKDSDVHELIEQVNELIDALQSIRDEEKADFSRDEVMRPKIDHIFDENPRAFGYEKTYSWDTGEERAELITALKEQFHLEAPKQTKQQPMPLDQLLMPSPSAEQEETPLEPELVEALNIVKAQDQNKDKNQGFKDVNLGYAFINMQVKAFDIVEGRIKKLINQLSDLNEHNKDLSALINALTRCKESGKADFSKDPEIRPIIDRIFERNPKIFGGQKAYTWDNEKQIDVLLSSLDSEVKAKVAEINQITMYINVRFDERIQYSENARKILDMLIRHCESIISKYHKT